MKHTHVHHPPLSVSLTHFCFFLDARFPLGSRRQQHSQQLFPIQQQLVQGGWFHCPPVTEMFVEWAVGWMNEWVNEWTYWSGHCVVVVVQSRFWVRVRGAGRGAIAHHVTGLRRSNTFRSTVWMLVIQWWTRETSSWVSWRLTFHFD